MGGGGGFGLEQDSKGKDVDLSIYKGKVLLIVNVASKWFVSFSFWVFFLFFIFMIWYFSFL